MTLPSPKFGAPNRRAYWLLVAGMQAWIACSETAPPTREGGSVTGGERNIGNGGSSGGSGGTSHQPGPDESAGASGSEAGDAGSVGVAGIADTGGAGGAADVANAGASGASDQHFTPAPHTPFPLVTAHGGPVLANIELVPLYFGADDPLHADLEGFNSWIVTSNFWQQIGAEYGVYPGTRLPALQFPSPSPSSISVTQIATWLDARIADGSLPKPSANTLFALFYQAGVTITTATGVSCRSFAAFHDSSAISNPVFSGNIHYAIIPRCSFSPGDELQIVTDVASHEYMEAATNPLPLSNPAWAMDNESGPLEAWSMLSGPAVADLCLNQAYAVVDGYSVNDIWSNAAALAGNNPCQPSDPAHPFFSVSAGATIYHAAAGTTLSIPARAWSNQPAPDWSLDVNWGLVPYSDFDGQATLSRTKVNNGDELTATVSIPANPAVVNGRSVYRFTIDSIDPINPNFSHPWPIMVVVP